jgi:hypothetical protein
MNTLAPIADALRRLTGKSTLRETMEQELLESSFALLRAQNAVEYAEAIVAYNKAKIGRLQVLLLEAKCRGD